MRCTVVVGCEECGAHRTRAPFFSLSHRAKRFEGCAHIGHEERRLFPGREVCAFGMVAVVDELHIRLLCPALRRLINFFSKRAHAHRKLDASRVEEAACRQIMLRVPVKTRRRDRGICQPIERDVVENVVAAQPFGLAVENAGDHLVAANVVIEYPARKTNRRI